MALFVQILQDAPESVDSDPLFEFVKWAREWDTGCSFACHYDMVGGESTITDFGMLRQELDDYFENVMGNLDDDTRPEPPDIRKWLQSEIDAGRVLAWISW